MEQPNIPNVKTQLAGFLSELKEKQSNPFKGTVLESLTEEVRAMRKTYGLSYKEIASKLMALRVETDKKEVADFCRFILKIEGRRGAKRRRSAAPVR
jgi:RecB family endonuclease NucS